MFKKNSLQKIKEILNENGELSKPLPKARFTVDVPEIGLYKEPQIKLIANYKITVPRLKKKLKKRK